MTCKVATIRRWLTLFVVFPMAALATSAGEEGQTVAEERETYILAAGRRLPFLYAISLSDALKPENNHTGNAIISRNKVALDALNGSLLGDPANLVVSEDGGTLFVVNHHGSIDNTVFRQHGGRGQVAVLEVDAMLDPRNDKTHNALLRHLDSGGFGALGAVLLPDMVVIANAENQLTEDGGNRVTFVDRKTGSLRGTVELSLGKTESECDYPVPHVSPHGPPQNLAVLAPDPSWGCFPDPNGLAMGLASDGRAYLFTANGGTNDVSVISLALALQGDHQAEIGRVPNQRAAWGMVATPDKRHIIVASGGSQSDDWEGNTISIIDVDQAVSDAKHAEVARVRVGTDNPDEPSYPLILTVTPDGDEIIVPNLLTDNVSVVSLKRALAGEPNAEVARIPLTRRDGRPARPKGAAVSADGRYAFISGGPRIEPFSQETGYIYILDLASRRLVGTVTGVGNDPYGLTTVER